MRISYIARASIPSQTANSIQVMKMCQAMAMEEHSVRLIIPKLNGLTAAETRDSDIWTHYGIKMRFPIETVPCGFSNLKGISDFFMIIRAIRRGAGLIYTRDLRIAALSSLVHAPTLLELHQVPEGRYGPAYFRISIRRRGVRKLVLITRGLMDLINEAFPNALRSKEVTIAPDGVDLDRYEHLPEPDEAARSLGADTIRFRVGYSGSLYAGRGIGFILDLAHKLPQMEFWLMGGNVEAVTRWRSQAVVQELKNVRFFGFVKNQELPTYQAACHILLMPFEHKIAVSGNRGDTSAVTSPMKMFEYMATGRLIISSDLSVFREVLNDRNAVLCPPDNFAEWLKALKRAETDCAWRTSFGAQARKDVRQFSWRKRVRKIFYA